MSYKIEYSPTAIRDLDRVWAEVYEASQSEETTINYVDGLMDQVSAKRDFPKSGSPLYYEGNIIDTAPTIEGQQYVLWFVIASVLYIFGVTSKLIGIDFQEFREKLNELCVYYLDSMKD